MSAFPEDRRRPYSSFVRREETPSPTSQNDEEHEMVNDQDDDFTDDYIKQIFNEEDNDEEECGQLDLSDIPEISSALEKLNERPSFRMCSRGSSSRSTTKSSSVNSNDGMPQPWIVTSCVPNLPLLNENAPENRDDAKDSGDWIR